jgi:integrase/recombinase XerD
MATHRVSIYTRIARQDQPAKPKTIYAAGTVFFLRFKRAGKRVRKTLLSGTTYQQAVLAAKSQELELFQRDSTNYDHTTAITKIAEAPAFREPEPEPVRQETKKELNPNTKLDAAVDLYLANKVKKSGKTRAAYSFTLRQFYRRTGPKLLKQIGTGDLLNFVQFLRETGVGNRTIYNRLIEVGTLLRAFKVQDVREMLKDAQVKYEDKIVEAYRPDELKLLFAKATAAEWLKFQFFLCSGAREQEVQYAIWDNIDFVEKVFNIREHKVEYTDGSGETKTVLFTTKTAKGRIVPLPDFLLAKLKVQMLNSTGQLLFPTESGAPNGHMLRELKRLGQRAGITSKLELHKFRKSYAVLQSRNSVDVRTIQDRLGHADLVTTLAYLKSEEARSQRSRDQVNSTFPEVYA